MHALLIGATGATGIDLLHLLLEDDSFDQVTIFVRRKLIIQHEKLRVHVIDFDKPEQWTNLVKGDVLFSCLGATLKTAGSKEALWKIDYDYQFRFAKSARENNVNTYVLVSDNFASPYARSYYSRMKGLLEESVKALEFARLTIFNPPLLIRKNTDRAVEIVGLKVVRVLNKIGIFHAQKPLQTEILAQAMIYSAKKKNNGITSLRGRAIWELARGMNAK